MLPSLFEQLPRDLDPEIKSYKDRLDRTVCEAALIAYPASASGRMRLFNYVYEWSVWLDGGGRVPVAAAHARAEEIVAYLSSRTISDVEGGQSLRVYRDVSLENYTKAQQIYKAKGEYPPPLIRYVGWRGSSNGLPLASKKVDVNGKLEYRFYDRPFAHLGSAPSGASLFQWFRRTVQTGSIRFNWGLVLEPRIVASAEAIEQWATLSSMMSLEAIIMHLRRGLIEHGGCNVVGGGRNSSGSPSRSLVSKVEKLDPRFGVNRAALNLTTVQNALFDAVLSPLSGPDRDNRAKVLRAVYKAFGFPQTDTQKKEKNLNRVKAAEARVKRERAQEAQQLLRQQAHLQGRNLPPLISLPVRHHSGTNLQDFTRKPRGEMVLLAWSDHKDNQFEELGSAHIRSTVELQDGETFVNQRTFNPVIEAKGVRPSAAWLVWNKKQRWLELHDYFGKLYNISTYNGHERTMTPAIWTPFMLASCADEDGWLYCLPEDEQRFALGVLCASAVLIGAAIYEESPQLVAYGLNQMSLRRITLKRFTFFGVRPVARNSLILCRDGPATARCLRRNASFASTATFTQKAFVRPATASSSSTASFSAHVRCAYSLACIFLASETSGGPNGSGKPELKSVMPRELCGAARAEPSVRSIRLSVKMASWPPCPCAGEQ